MDFIRGLFRSLVASLLVSMLFMLGALSLFVGNFPPSIKQVKNVYAEFQKMMALKQTVMDQFAGKDTAELADALQKQRLEQISKLGKARGDVKEAPHPADLVDAENAPPQATLPVQAGQVGAQIPGAVPAGAAQALAQNVPTQVDIPAEMKQQLFEMRSEIFRLSQRVVELERKQMPGAPQPGTPQAGVVALPAAALPKSRQPAANHKAQPARR